VNFETVSGEGPVVPRSNGSPQSQLSEINTCERRQSLQPGACNVPMQADVFTGRAFSDMALLTPNDPQTATGETNDLCRAVERPLRRVLDTLGPVAHLPSTLEAYLRSNERFDRTTLTPNLLGLVTVAIAAASSCAMQSAGLAAGRGEEVPEDELSAARRGEAANPHYRLRAAGAAQDGGSTRVWPPRGVG